MDASAALRIADFGDAPVLPADAVPVTLGGDHAVTEPAVARAPPVPKCTVATGPCT
jgi:arginase family enzyme